MIPPPLIPSAVLLRRIHIASYTDGKPAPDGAGARLQRQKMCVATRTQPPARKREVGSQEVVG